MSAAFIFEGCTDDFLKRLREQGWMVAVHNDYKLQGKQMTFWLFTHPDGRYVKGEAETDIEALKLVEKEAGKKS